MPPDQVKTMLTFGSVNSHAESPPRCQVTRGLRMDPWIWKSGGCGHFEKRILAISRRGKLSGVKLKRGWEERRLGEQMSSKEGVLL